MVVWLAALTVLALAAGVVAASGAQLLLGGGAKAPAWAHWWCSPALHSGAAKGGHGRLLGIGAGLLPHWPHLLAVTVTPATLLYLRRANARYHAGRFDEPAGASSGAAPAQIS